MDIKTKQLIYTFHNDTVNVYKYGCIDYLDQLILIWI